MAEPLRLRVPHAQVDDAAEVRLSALLGFLEQAAIEASNDVGLDPAWYASARRMWIVRRTRIERFRPVGGGDLLECRTRVLDWRRARSLRTYEVRLVEPGRGTRTSGLPAAADGGPPIVATAVTDWVFCDVDRARPVSIPEEVRRAFSPDGAAEGQPRLDAPEPPGEAALRTRFLVRPSHVDHMGHANNAVWADFLEDAARDLPGLRREADGSGAAARLVALDVEYLAEASRGDEVAVASALLRDGRIAQEATRGGTRLVRAASAWGRVRRSPILGGPPVAEDPA
ncbi:hypothetical protein KGQ64_06915 [bacterium]|nr:hypothetical protein [bacterium]